MWVIVYGLNRAMQGQLVNDVNVLQQDLALMLPLVLIGFLGTVVGGSVAGWMGRESEWLHGALVGVIAVLGTVIVEPFSPDPTWFTTVSLIGCGPAGLLGGYLAGLFRAARRRW